MQQCHQQCGVISAAMLRLFAAALGMPHDFFEEKTNKHHSNMQVGSNTMLPCLVQHQSHKLVIRALIPLADVNIGALNAAPVAGIELQS